MAQLHCVQVKECCNEKTATDKNTHPSHRLIAGPSCWLWGNAISAE